MYFKSASEFYTSQAWRKFRSNLMLERVNDKGEIICAECGKPIIHGYDCIAHHVKEITPQTLNDVSITLNPENVVLVHASCHNIIHQRFGGRLKDYQRKVYLIYGAPCSGKTTYVRNNMSAGDLVIDLDTIWQCISGQDRYVKPNELKPIVFDIRNKLLDSVKTRQGRWGTAWIIEGLPLLGERMRRIETLGAEPIFINTPKQTCLERLINSPNGRNIDEYTRYINDWFNTYQSEEV